MKNINAIIKKIGHCDYKIVLVYEDGTKNELPAIMSLRTAALVQKLFRRNI